MGQVGLVLVALGIIGLIYGIMQKLKAGRVADAPLVSTGDAAQKGAAVASPKGAISAQGNVLCQQPLISPVTGTPCLYYMLKVTASWKDGDTQKTKELTKEKRAAQFAIDDGSGPVWIDARDGGDFEPTQKKEETKGTGLLGGITGQDLVFGNYRVSTGMLSLGTKYTVEEQVLPIVPKLYACGKVGSSNEITAPGWRSLIMSNKSRDDLLASATKGAKIFLAGGAGAFVVGLALGIVGAMTSSDAKAASPAPTATAAATATATAATSAAPQDSASAAPTNTPAPHPAANTPAPAKATKPVAKPAAAHGAKAKK
jgi:hypothetical protein